MSAPPRHMCPPHQSFLPAGQLVCVGSCVVVIVEDPLRVLRHNLDVGTGDGGPPPTVANASAPNTTDRHRDHEKHKLWIPPKPAHMQSNAISTSSSGSSNGSAAGTGALKRPQPRLAGEHHPRLAFDGRGP